MMGWEQGCDAVGRFGTGHMWGGGFSMLGPVLGLLLLLSFLALLALGALWLARLTRRASGAASAGGSSSAMDLLQNRLAAGELSIEEYHRLRDELRS